MSPVGTAQKESVSVKPFVQFTTVFDPQGVPVALITMFSIPQLSQHVPED